MRKLLSVLAMVLLLVSVNVYAGTYTVFTSGWFERGDLAGYRFSAMFTFDSPEDIAEIDSIPIVFYDGRCKYGNFYYRAWFIKMPYWHPYAPNKWHAFFDWAPAPYDSEELGIEPIYAATNFLPFNKIPEGDARGWMRFFYINGK